GEASLVSMLVEGSSPNLAAYDGIAFHLAFVVAIFVADIKLGDGELHLPDPAAIVSQIVIGALIVGTHVAEKAEEPHLAFRRIGSRVLVLVADGICGRLG